MVRTRRQRSAASDLGAAAVEFAIILPVLILILGGIIEFGRVMYTQSIAVGAAREGARTLAVGYTRADAVSRVSGAMFGYSGTGFTTTTTRLPSGSAFTGSTALGCPGPGATVTAADRVRVEVSVTGFAWIFPLPMSPPAMGGTAEMRCGG